MAFTQLEIDAISKEMDAYLVRHRPPPHIRPKLDIGYRIVNQSVEIYEIRPSFARKGEITEIGNAKTTYVRQANHWRVFWMRANGNWFGYEPNHTVPALSEFIRVVERDEHACFFG